MANLSQAKEELERKIADVKQQKIKDELKQAIEGIKGSVVSQLVPTIEAVAIKANISKEELLQALSEIKVEVPEIEVHIPDIIVPEVNVPEVKIPDIKIPEIKAPNVEVTVPEIKVPDVVIPPFPSIPQPKVTVNVDVDNILAGLKQLEQTLIDTQIELPEEKEYTFKKPLPVIPVDAAGYPINFGGGGSNNRVIHYLKGDVMTAVTDDSPLPVNASVSATIEADYGFGEVGSLTTRTVQASDSVSSVYITGAASSTYAEFMNPDGRVKVELPTGSSSLTDTELRASAVPVEQVSGSNWSTYVTGIFGSTITSDVLNADNRIRVSVETGGSGLTDSELRATAVPVSQVSGATWSTNVVGFSSTVSAYSIDGDGNYRGVYPVSQESPFIVDQLSGANWSTYVTGAATSTYEEILNPDGRVPVELPTQDVAVTLDGESVDISGGTIDTVTTVTGVTNSIMVSTLPETIYDQLSDVAGMSNALIDTISWSKVRVDIAAQEVGLDVYQVSGTAWSTYVTGFSTSIGATILNGDGTYRDTFPVSSANTLDVKQVSGANWSVAVSGFSSSIGATILNADGTYRDTYPTLEVRSANATTTAVSIGADASTNVVPTNTERKSVTIVHTSTSNLYVSTTTASSTSAFPIVANQAITFDEYVGPVNARAEEGAGTISVRYIEII